MVNPHRGDVPFEVNSKAYTLRYSHNALVALERSQGKGLPKIMSELSDAETLSLGKVISFLWAGLQKHHPGLTEEDVGDLLDDLDGGASRATALIEEGLTKAFTAPGTKGTNPPQMGTGNGAGTVSSSSISALDTASTNSGT